VGTLSTCATQPAGGSPDKLRTATYTTSRYSRRGEMQPCAIHADSLDEPSSCPSACARVGFQGTPVTTTLSTRTANYSSILPASPRPQHTYLSKHHCFFPAYTKLPAESSAENRARAMKYHSWSGAHGHTYLTCVFVRKLVLCGEERAGEPVQRREA
jgi:hypothetical protein